MRLVALIIILGLWIAKAGALECPAPALLKQADGKDDTLHSWCELDGVREGVYEAVSLKTGLELRAHYKKNELNGRFQRFLNNKAVVDGNFTAGDMTGEWTRYWDNGEVRDRGTWNEDKPIGRWRNFSDKGKLKGEVNYDAQGKIIAQEKPKPENNLTSADRWRLRAGIAHTERDQLGGAGGIGVGADHRLFNFGRWFRTDLGARIVPDNRAQNGNSGYNYNAEKVYSGQFALSFDLIPNVSDPVVFYCRFGIHLIAFEKTRLMGGLGLRYHLTNKRQNWIPNGLFAEFSGSEGSNNNNNNNGQNPGPGSGPSSNNNQAGGAETFFAGALWSYF